MCRIIAFTLIALIMSPAGAAEVADVMIPDTVRVADQDLRLNGAGIRKKFWIKVYVGALYLPSSTTSAAEAVAMDGPKRISMHMLYDVSRKKLVGAWEEGFEKNTPEAELGSLSGRMQDFYGLWSDSEDGDEFILDYVPGEGTRVYMNGSLKGTIPGEDFNRAMLRIWLGDEPADDDLKEGMLGG